MAVTVRTPAVISAREEFFRHALESHIASPAMVSFQMEYHEAMPAILAAIYFATTDNYKELYLKTGHGTDAAKQAALTCAAIAAIKPIRPPASIDLAQINAEEYLFANPMLAIKTSCGIVRHPFEKRGFDDRRRVYVALHNFSLTFASAFLNAAKSGEDLYSIDPALNSVDESALSLLISQFSLYSQMTVPHQYDR